MKAGQDYTAVESISPLRGLMTTPASTRLDPAFSPRLLNCVVRDGVVSRRGGYQPLGQRLVGRVLALTEFGPIGENPNLVALTSHRQYAFNVDTNRFVDLTPGQVSYTITDVGTHLFKVSGNHVTEFSNPASRLIPVVGGANEGVYTVATVTYTGGGTNKTTINVSETLPSAVVAGVLTLASDLQTGTRDLIDYIGVTDLNNRRFLMTNGIDAPRMWSGVITSPFQTWVPNFDDFVTCKSFAVFAEHLFLGGVTTLAEEPQLVAWSAAGEFDEFQDPSTDAGVQLLYSLSLGIRGMKILGDRLAIYSADNVMMATFVGLPAVFSFEVVIPEGTRLVSSKGVVSLNVGHVFLSEENIYLFDGSRGLRVLGEGIYTDYKTNKDQELLFASCTLNDYSKRTLFFAVPDGSGGTMVYTCVYDVFNLADLTWAKEKYLHNPRALGFYTRHAGVLTWEDNASVGEPANMPWADELGAWSEEAEQLNFPIRCFGTDLGRVYVVTEGVLPDDGTAALQSYETMDFSPPRLAYTPGSTTQDYLSELSRWGEIEFEASGTDVLVEYSKDRGDNFTVVETVSLIDSYKSYRLPIDATSRILRIRFSSYTNFRLRWVKLWFKAGSPR